MVSQHIIKENAENILEIITKLEKLGWQQIKATAVKNKYNEYFIHIVGFNEQPIAPDKISGAQNAILCSVSRYFGDAVVKVSPSIPTAKVKKNRFTHFDLYDDAQYLSTKE